MADVTDASGKLLFSLRDKFLAIMHTFVAEDERGNEVFRVKKNLASESSLGHCASVPSTDNEPRLKAVGTKLTATFRNAVTGQDAEMSIKGDMFGFGSVITLNGSTPVAQISRKMMNMREWAVDKQTVGAAPRSKMSPPWLCCEC